DPHRLEHLQLPPAARAPRQVGADRVAPRPGQAVEEIAKGVSVHDCTGETGPPTSRLASHRSRGAGPLRRGRPPRPVAAAAAARPRSPQTSCPGGAGPGPATPAGTG